jgi:hypothetical protein
MPIYFEVLRYLTTGHDSTHKTHTGQDKSPKKFKLHTIFGSSSDEFDPMDRLLWVAGQYLNLRQDPQWTDIEEEEECKPLLIFSFNFITNSRKK